MASTRKEKLLEQKAALEAKIRREDAKEKQKERRIDTQRKIVVGYVALEMAEMDESFRAVLHAQIDKRVTRPDHRKLFGLAPLEEPSAAPAAVPEDTPPQDD